MIDRDKLPTLTGIMSYHENFEMDTILYTIVDLVLLSISSY